MKLTGAGKFVILLLALGLAVGGFRFWQGSGGKLGNLNLPKMPDMSGNRNGGAGSGDASGNPSGNPSGSTGEIELVSSPSKKGWLNEQIEKFNNSNGKGFRVKFTPLETREAMHAILDGTAKPVIYCPSNTSWTQRLQEAWAAKNPGRPILNLDDPTSYRVFFRTPIVFLTTKSKANFLRSQLGTTDGWDNLRALSMGRKRAPWGRFKWAHADPLTANSGNMTLGLMLAYFAEASGQGGAPQSVATSSRFRTFMKEISRSLVYDLPAESGSSALLKAFVENPSRYDVITAYENTALETISQNPNFAVIYPTPTVSSEHVVAVLNGDWVSNAQKQAAQAFMAFLGTPDSLREGAKYRFRPATGSSTSLQAEITRLSDAGFRQSVSSIDLPPYEALNAAVFQWRIHIAKKPV